jgi:hypothetical protein
LCFSIQKTIKDIAHKAFWDLLKEEFEEDPPKYDRALTLLEEIKEVGLLFHGIFFLNLLTKFIIC